MSSRWKKRIFLLGYFLFGWAVFGFAQRSGSNLPSLSPDPAIQRFKLPDGIHCYFVPEKGRKGIFEAALLQKADASLSRSALASRAQEYFSEARIADVVLEDFLSRAGICPGRQGFISSSRGAVVYRFSSVSGAHGPAVRDSLLYALMAIARVWNENGAPSSSQAICLCGDFDTGATKTALTTLSMTVPYSPGEIKQPAYSWNPDDMRGVGIFETRGDTPYVSVRWKSARVPRDMMQTVFPVVIDKMSGELEWVLKRRLYSAFCDAGLHVWLDWHHTGSGSAFGDERYELRAYCPSSALSAVRSVLTQELCRLSTWGVSVEEYGYARDIFRSRWQANLLSVDNSRQMERCIGHFFYDASLATESDKIDFAYRNVPDSTSAAFFTKYMKRLIRRTSPADSSLAAPREIRNRDSIAAKIASYKSQYILKPPQDREEKTTGGMWWKFSTGVDVLYCVCPTSRMIHYAYAVKGTRKWADKDFLCCLDGVSEEELSNYLASLGIVMDIQVGQTDVRLCGQVPYDHFEDLLLVLSALSAQPENVNLFGPDACKMLVLAGDIFSEKIKKQLSKHIFGLRRGGAWRSDEPVLEVIEDEYEDLSAMPGKVVEWFAPLDKSATTNALVALARQAVSLSLARSFCGSAATFSSRIEFADLSLEGALLMIKAHRVASEGFNSEDDFLDDGQLAERIRRSVASLAAEPLSAEVFAYCKKRAMDEFETVKSTPEYSIRLALDRYIEKRDLLPRFKKEMEGLTPSMLQNLFFTFRELVPTPPAP